MPSMFFAKFPEFMNSFSSPYGTSQYIQATSAGFSHAMLPDEAYPQLYKWFQEMAAKLQEQDNTE